MKSLNIPTCDEPLKLNEFESGDNQHTDQNHYDGGGQQTEV